MGIENAGIMMKAIGTLIRFEQVIDSYDMAGDKEGAKQKINEFVATTQIRAMAGNPVDQLILRSLKAELVKQQDEGIEGHDFFK